MLDEPATNNDDIWTTEDERCYRELQSIWHQANDFSTEKRFGLAIRLLTEGISRAELPEYRKTERLELLKRDLAFTLSRVGETSRAIELLQEIEDYGGAASILHSMGDALGALASYKKAGHGYREKVASLLFAFGQDVEALDVLEDMLKNIPIRLVPTSISKQQTLIALTGLQLRYGDKALMEERAQIEKRHKKLYCAVIHHYGNWRSALIQLTHKGAEARLSKIRSRSLEAKPLPIPPATSLDYEESEVMAALLRAGTAFSDRESLHQGLRLIDAGNIDDARNLIAQVVSSQTGMVRGLAIDFVRMTYLLECRFEEALDYHSGYLYRTQLNEYLNLLLLTGRRISGALLASRYRWRINPATQFLRQHHQALVSYCQQKLDHFAEEHGAPLLQWVANQHPDLAQGTWGFFLGWGESELEIDRFPFHRYYHHKIDFGRAAPYLGAIDSMLHDVENRLRSAMGVPKVGEGWLSEAEMVAFFRQRVGHLEIIPQGSPVWLGRQRFDIYIPTAKLAIEYQGLQHYEAVEFFGGAEGLKLTMARDRRKAALAKANGVRIEVIRYDENTEERVSDIILKYDLAPE